MFGIFRSKKELNYKSTSIASMYILRDISILENRLLDLKLGDIERSNIEFDISCLKDVLEYIN